jgi:acyl-CoA reductase-like NAD-dependent aldehyde dehydrogenase
MPVFVGGRFVGGRSVLAVPDRFTGEQAFRVGTADAAMIENAIAAAHASRWACGHVPLHLRVAALRRIAMGVEQASARLTKTIVAEAGKPVRDARAEVARAAETFRAAAAACAHGLEGEMLRLDMSERGAGRRAVTQRVPAGVVSMITPFNFPLNLVAHKVAPAIAAGCPWVLKPSDKTPATALRLGEIVADSGLVEGSWSIVPATVEDSRALVTDDRIAVLSFTGSVKVGWSLKAACGRKRVVLELGGDATAIIEPSADVAHACARIAVGGYSYAGQSCISVQHVLAHDAVYAAVRDGLTKTVSTLAFGDPRDERTAVGPLINEGEAKRIESWIANAVRGGARILCGGTRQGSIVAPTLIENIPTGCELATEEAFGPVVCLSPYATFDEAVAKVNASRFGLQCGVFTRELATAMKAWDVLEVGAVVINDVPTFRTESMPYGGVKESGLGREGVRRSIHEFTEERLLVLDMGGAS